MRVKLIRAIFGEKTLGNTKSNSLSDGEMNL